MAQETPRLKIPYPSQGEANYFNAYQDGMLAIDADVFAALSRPNIIIHGGGNIGWDLNGSDYEFSFDADINIQLPQYGVAQSVAFATYSPLVVPPAHFIIMGANYGSTSVAPSFITATTQVTVDGNEVVLAWHNPDTNELVFTTGLVIALGGTATGLQPQGGGGGGSITVTDGSTTVNPATTVTVVGGVVADLGGGNAEITVTGGGAPIDGNFVTIGGTGTLTDARSLIDGIGTGVADGGAGGDVYINDQTIITGFVVDKDGNTTPYTTIQDAIDGAAALRGLTGVDQIVYIRPSRASRYVEDLTLYEGISLMGLVPQKRQLPDLTFPTPVFDDPIIRVEIDGSHTFGYKQVARTCFDNIVFYGKDTFYVITVGHTDDNPSSIQFRNCRFEHNTGSLFFKQDSTLPNANLTVAFSDCSFRAAPDTGRADSFLIGSDSGSYGTRSTITFDRCFFINEGTDRSLVRINAPYNTLTLSDCYTYECDFDIAWHRCAVLLQRCTFDNKASGSPIFIDNTGLGAGNGELNFRSCTFRTSSGYVWRAPNGTGFTVYDNASIFDGFSTSGLIYPFAYGSNITYDPGGERIMPASFAGTHLEFSGGVTRDIHMGVTTVVVDTNASVSSTIVNLPDAQVCHGQEIAIVDGGNKAGSRNITVACPTTAVIGPNNPINHNSQVVVFRALYWHTTGQWVWKSVSSLF